MTHLAAIQPPAKRTPAPRLNVEAIAAKGDYDYENAVTKSLRAKLARKSEAERVQAALRSPFEFPLPIPDYVQDAIRESMAEGRRGSAPIGRADGVSRIEEALALRDQGLSYREIAEAMGISVKSAEGYISQARRARYYEK